MGRETKIKIVDGIEYTASNNRMRYNPEYHENHGKPYATDDYIYMCSMWDSMNKADIAFALGKTHSSVMTRVCDLKRKGKFDYYKNLDSEVLKNEC